MVGLGVLGYLVVFGRPVTLGVGDVGTTLGDGTVGLVVAAEVLL